MATPEVTVIDYGLCNIFSVVQAFEACGAKVKLTSSPVEVAEAKSLVLPGVGAFEDGMNGLKAYGLVEAIREYADSQRPLLGICLGMQMLMDTSAEFGDHAGLGLIGGRVEEIPKTASNGEVHKIPHIGWSPLKKPDNAIWEQSILDGIDKESSVYFVHSYTCRPENEKHRLADCEYNGRRISAAIRSGNIYGCQFHPEKSARIGLQIIRNFVSL